MSKIQEKFVETKFGKISYLQIGEGEKTAVYIHGWFGNPEFALKLEDTFCPKGYKIIAPSLPGHGKSFGVTPGFTCAKLLETMHDFYTQLRLINTITIGYSVGGALAWDLANDWDKLVSKVVVIDAYCNLHNKIPWRIVKHWLLGKRLRSLLFKRVHFRPCALLAVDIYKNLKVYSQKENIPALVLWGDRDEVALISDWLKMTGFNRDKIIKFPGDHWWMQNHTDELKHYIAKFAF